VSRETGGASGDASKGFGKAEKAPAVSLAPQDRKWELQPYDVEEWRGWLQKQRAEAGVQGGQVYVQVGSWASLLWASLGDQARPRLCLRASVAMRCVCLRASVAMPCVP
jgi:hypothetical protein